MQLYTLVNFIFELDAFAKNTWAFRSLQICHTNAGNFNLPKTWSSYGLSLISIDSTRVIRESHGTGWRLNFSNKADQTSIE